MPLNNSLIVATIQTISQPMIQIAAGNEMKRTKESQLSPVPVLNRWCIVVVVEAHVRNTPSMIITGIPRIIISPMRLIILIVYYKLPTEDIYINECIFKSI